MLSPSNFVELPQSAGVNTTHTKRLRRRRCIILLLPPLISIAIFKSRPLRHRAATLQEHLNLPTVLVGQWDGFCCGPEPRHFQANICEPCLPYTHGAKLSRDALYKVSNRTRRGIVFNSAAMTYTSASWHLQSVREYSGIRTLRDEFIAKHDLKTQDCSPKFPRSRIKCVHVPHELVIPNWYLFHVISFTGPYISETKILPPRLPWQLRAVINMESVQYWPHMAHPDVRSAYDIHVGIHRKLIDGPDTQVMFEQIGKPEDYNTTIPSRTQYGDNIVVAFISNCESMNDREAYLEELMKFIDVHSYGACLRTKNLNESETSVWHDLEHKREVQGRYMFTLAFENANEDDWVTEKLFDPLRAGSIPVYMGANNVDNYLPCVNASCIIEVRKFVNPKDLASHLLHVSQNENMFDALHAWRAHPIREDFIQLTKLTRQNHPCAMCERAAALFQL